MANKSKSTLYGYEDSAVFIGYGLFTGGYYSINEPSKTWLYMTGNNLPFKVSSSYLIKTAPGFCDDNKELLKDEAKVFVHPCCSIARTLVYSKYKKCLDPYKADAIVIPELPKTTSWDGIHSENNAVFVNSKTKTVLIAGLPDNSDSYYKVLYDSLTEGNTLRDILASIGSEALTDIAPMWLDSEFVYAGRTIAFQAANYRFIYEAFEGTLPYSKTVFEKSVLESLGNEDNRIDAESLVSILDMLDSNDTDTRASGLKALSVMDYIRFPNSVIYVTNNTLYKWYHDPASNSTAVKYMLKTLRGGRYNRNSSIRYHGDISQEDYDLFEKVYCKHENLHHNEFLRKVMSYPFMVVNSEGMLQPVIKVS